MKQLLFFNHESKIQGVILERLPKAHGRHVLLGTAVGLNLRHCAEIAARHCPGFARRASAYEVTSSELSGMLEKATSKPYYCVNFYEKAARRRNEKVERGRNEVSRIKPV